MSDDPARNTVPRGTIEQRLDRGAADAFWLAVALADRALTDPARDKGLFLDDDVIRRYLADLASGATLYPPRHSTDEGEEWKTPATTRQMRTANRETAARLVRQMDRVKTGGG